MENDFFPVHRDDETDRVAPDVTTPESVSCSPEPGAVNHGDLNPETEPAPTSATKIIDGIATGLSWILVPLNMPLFGLWFLFGLSLLSVLPLSLKWQLTGIFFGLDIVVPMVLVYILKWMGLVDDLGLNGRKERLIPYLISIAVLAGSGYWCQRLGFPLWTAGFYYGGAVAGTVNLIVNFWWKISAHAAGMAGVLALLVRIWAQGDGFGPTQTWLIIWIVLAGLLGASRVWLGRHTPMQVFCGTAVGFTAVILMSGI